MFSRTLLVLLVVSQVVADNIRPDWKILTDFTAKYQYDLKNLVNAGLADDLPFSMDKEFGTIKFNLHKESLEINSHGAARLKAGVDVAPELGNVLDNAFMRGAGTLAFDGSAGFVGIKAHGRAHIGGRGGGLNFCVKVNFPQGLLPPGQMLEQGLDVYKPMIEQQLNAVPSTDVEIDSEDVAIIKVPASVFGPEGPQPQPQPSGSSCEGWENCQPGSRCERPTDAFGTCQPCEGQDDCNNEPPSGPSCQFWVNCQPGSRCERPTDAIGTCQPCQGRGDCNSGSVGSIVYVGLRHNAAPFGAGITAPKDGKWHPVLKFPSWTHGAGSIEEFSCADMPGASTSAAELLADPEASKTLEFFDELLTRLHGVQPINKVFAAVPARPSAIFHDAAAKELNTKANAVLKSQQHWPSVALAGAAGALGGVAVLVALLKLTGRRPLRTEPLLEQCS